MHACDVCALREENRLRGRTSCGAVVGSITAPWQQGITRMLCMVSREAAPWQQGIARMLCLVSSEGCAGVGQVARQAKLAEQRTEQEERSRRALVRAAAPAFRRVGKPAMLRSMLVAQVQKVSHHALQLPLTMPCLAPDKAPDGAPDSDLKVRRIPQGARRTGAPLRTCP